MKKITLRFLFLIIYSVILSPDFLFAYTINGNLSDWGVTPGVFGSSNWIPNPGIYYIEEDQNTNYLNPGYGGQLFDAEAMYADYDNTNLFFAIVTGHPATGASGWRPGDVAFDFGINGSYEYGIAATTHNGFTQGNLYSVNTWGQGLSNWGNGNIGHISAPTEILSTNGGLIALANLVYNNTYYGSNLSGNHWVIEGKIPYSYFGSNWGKPFRMHWTQTCGNDAIDLNVPIPEPATLSLLGLGLVGLIGWKKKGGEAI